MDNFEEIKNLWQSHNTEKVPSFSNISNAIKVYRSAKKKKIIFFVFMSVVFIFTWIWIMFDYNSNLLTTRIGETLFLFISVYLLLSKIKLLKRNKQEELLCVNDYLDNVKIELKKGAMDKTKTFMFILGSVALPFYVYEVFSVNKTLLTIGYFSLFLYIVSGRKVGFIRDM